MTQPAHVSSTVQRPRVICHMLMSIDGRIVPSSWPNVGDVRREYETIHAGYDADAWMCGRITMEPFAGGVRSPEDVKHEATPDASRPDYRASRDAQSFAVAIDASGRLAWQTNDIDGDHVVTVLTERVSDEYLASLRAQGVSYLFAGVRDVSFATALGKLATDYGIETVMLEGGGKINGSLMAAGLIDEVSVLVAPITDGRMRTPTLFDVDAGDTSAIRQLELISVEQRPSGVLWLRYRVQPAESA